jgi:hypothetical protein
VRTTSTVSVAGKECGITVGESFVRNFSAEIDSGDIICTSYTFSNTEIGVGTGKVWIEATRDISRYHTNLSTKGGEITYMGEKLEGNYQYESEMGIGILKILTDSADVNVSQQEIPLDIPDTDTDTDIEE